MVLYLYLNKKHSYRHYFFIEKIKILSFFYNHLVLFFTIEKFPISRDRVEFHITAVVNSHITL